MQSCTMFFQNYFWTPSLPDVSQRAAGLIIAQRLILSLISSLAHQLIFRVLDICLLKALKSTFHENLWKLAFPFLTYISRYFQGSKGLTLTNPLSANSIKWSNTLKQFVGKSWRIIWVCLVILWGCAAWKINTTMWYWAGKGNHSELDETSLSRRRG